jgi:hypothetical protein
MGLKRQTIDPLAETPFWQTRLFRFSCLGLAALALTGLTVYLVRENRRQQIQWRLDEDPRLSRIKNDLARRITTAKPEDERLPRALWLGRIRRVAETSAATGSAASCLIEMESPSLLAGTRGRKDAEPLTISGQDFQFSPQKPRAGETWLIAVRRAKDERLLIYSATRAEIP